MITQEFYLVQIQVVYYYCTTVSSFILLFRFNFYKPVFTTIFKYCYLSFKEIYYHIRVIYIYIYIYVCVCVCVCVIYMFLVPSVVIAPSAFRTTLYQVCQQNCHRKSSDNAEDKWQNYGNHKHLIHKVFSLRIDQVQASG